MSGKKYFAVRAREVFFLLFSSRNHRLALMKSALNVSMVISLSLYAVLAVVHCFVEFDWYDFYGIDVVHPLNSILTFSYLSLLCFFLLDLVLPPPPKKLTKADIVRMATEFSERMDKLAAENRRLQKEVDHEYPSDGMFRELLKLSADYLHRNSPDIAPLVRNYLLDIYHGSNPGISDAIRNLGVEEINQAKGVSFNISGGNNQILPNGRDAKQDIEG